MLIPVLMLIPMLRRDIWPEAGGDGTLREAFWEQAGPYAGGAVCGLHSPVGAERGGPLQVAWPG